VEHTSDGRGEIAVEVIKSQLPDERKGGSRNGESADTEGYLYRPAAFSLGGAEIACVLRELKPKAGIPEAWKYSSSR
jgi:hypothetical protein